MMGTMVETLFIMFACSLDICIEVKDLSFIECQCVIIATNTSVHLKITLGV